MSNPAEDVPADRPLRWSDGHFEFGALGLGGSGATGSGAVVELADQFHRAVEGMEVTVAVITDMHQASTDRATAVRDVESPERKISLGRPLVRHPVALRVGVASLVRRSRTGGYAEKPRVPSPLSDRCSLLVPSVLHFTNPSGSFKTPAKKARAVSVTTIVGSIETDGLRMVPVTRSLSRRF